MSEPLCQLCREDGDKVEAFGFCLDCCDYLCEDCYTIHRKPRPMRNHNLLDKEQMLKDKDTLPTKDSIVDTCQKHSETVKYFCPDHDSVGCSVCVTIDHKICEEIVHIPQAAEGIADSEEYHNLEQEIGETSTRFENIIPAATKNISKSDASSTKVAQEISAYMDAILATIKKLEDAVRNHADQCHNEDVQRMNSVISKSKEALETLKNMKTSMHSLGRMKQYNKLFIAIKTNNNALRKMQEELSEWENSNTVRISQFDPNSSLRKSLEGFDNMGELLHNMEGPDDSVESSSAEITEQVETEDMRQCGITAAFCKDVSIKSSTDKGLFCNIVGVVTVAENKVVIVYDDGTECDPKDSDKRINVSRVALIDIKRNRITSELVVPGLCLGIAKMNESHVALSLDGPGNTLLKINPSITVIRRLGTIAGGQLSFFNKEIFVSTGTVSISKVGMTGKDSTAVQLTDINRERQQIFATGIYGNNNQTKVYAIVAHSKLLENHSITYNSPSPRYLGHGVLGEWVKDKIELPKVPEAITMGEDGKLLFVLADDVIYVVRTGTTDASALLSEDEELCRVSALSFCSRSQQLVVAMRDCNFIKVYQVSGTW